MTIYTSLDKVPKHVHEHSASQDISSCGRSTYDDISLFGLSFLFDSEDDSYDADDSSCEFLQADLHEVSLNDDLSPPWAEPVDSKWKNEVATAMNAFRSSRVDHDDIVAFPVHVESEGLSQQIAGGSKEVVQVQHIENWRNNFLPMDEMNSSSPSKYTAISFFRFP